MARTAPAPNIPAIPGMNPGTFVMGGGAGSGGSGAGGGKGSGKGQGANGKSEGDDAQGGGKGACGAPGKDGECPRNHGSSSSGSATQGDPIDVVTGRVFTFPDADLVLPGPLPLVFSRSYSTTARRRDAGLGRGWSHTFAWEVVVVRRGAVLWTEDGLDVPFGAVARDDGVIGPHGWVLHRHLEGFALDVPDGTRRIFEPDPNDAARRRFRLSAIEDRLGNRIALTFDARGLTTLVDSAGRTIRTSLTREGRIAHLDVVCPSGRVLRAARYDYDAAGRLVGVVDADGHGTSYVYDDDDRLVRYRLPTGVVFHFRYDQAGRGVESWGEHESGREACLADDVPDLLADGRTRAKGIHHVKVEYGDDGYSEVVDPVTTFRYFGNEHGKVDKTVWNGTVYSRTYDARGHLTSYTDALGAVTQWERDLFGNETAIVDALGNRTVIERRPNGDIITVVEPNGAETKVEYVAEGILIHDPLGATFSIRYDARGLPIETVAPNGQKRLRRYDTQGNLIEIADEQGPLWHATYDELGRRTSSRDEGGEPTRYRYSERGLLVAREEPGGLISTFAYDGLGNQIEAIDPSGRRTILVRGGTGSLVEARLPNETSVQFRYDRKERLVFIQDARGQIWRAEIGPTGVRTREVGFDGSETVFKHDLEGRVVRATHSSGADVLLERDLLGNVVKRTRADGSEETFEYDFRGDVLRAQSGDTAIELERNAIGWIVRERQQRDGETFQVDLKHDAIGLPVALSTSLGHSATWRRDYAGRSFALLLDGTDEVLTQRSRAGLEVERLLPQGARMSFQYDGGGRLVAKRVVSPTLARKPEPAHPQWVGGHDPAATVDQWLEYNRSSELTSIRDAHRGTRTYDYDALGRIVATIDEAMRAERFGYDEAGNLYQPGGEGRAYDGANRLLRVGDTHYLHDAVGRLTEKRSGAAGHERVTRLSWNDAGMLTNVISDAGDEIDFFYDVFARRTRKDVFRRHGAGDRVLVRRTRFHWFGDTLLHEVTEDVERGRTRERRYHFDTDGEPWAHRELDTQGAADAGSGWVFYDNDVAGFPERLIAADGRVVGELTRTVWGSATIGDGSSATTPLRFIGQYADVETGLHYNRYRYYDPQTGRYISPDPIGLLGGLNLFAYAQNSPFFFGDRDGLVYSKIVDNSTTPPTVLTEGYSVDDARGRPPHAGGQIPQGLSDKPCAETQALQRLQNNMADEVRAEQAAAKKKGNKRQPFKPMTEAEIQAEAKARMQKKMQDPNVTLETFDKKGGERVDPCSRCHQMIDELKINEAVVGKKGKRGKYGTY